jgi:predicted nucleic acid-binding protein
MSARLILDANIIVRFLTNDPPDQALKAKALIEGAVRGRIELELTELCLAEVVWVLHSFYKCPRQQIVRHLQALLVTPGIVMSRRALLEDAVRRYAASSMDIADAFLAALAAERNLKVASFDEDFDQFEDVTRFSPE